MSPARRYAGPLRHAVVEITNRCNLRCPHCGSSSGEARPDELTWAELDALLTELRTLGCGYVTLLGGEPLLRPDWVRIASRVGELGMRLLLISNGLLFTEQTFAVLAALRPHLIGISIDGATPASYAALRGRDGLATCLGVLQRLLEDGHHHVNAITTFTRKNLNEFEALADLFANRRSVAPTGAHLTWQVQLANRSGDRFDAQQLLTRQDYAWLAERMTRIWTTRRTAVRLRHMDDFGYFPLDPRLAFLHQTWQGCFAGRRLIGVRSNGDVLGCLSLGDEFVEANLRQRSLTELWQDPGTFARLRHKIDLLEGECRTCPWATRCQAGCTAMAWSTTGTLGSTTHCLRSLELEAILAGLDPADRCVAS